MDLLGILFGEKEEKELTIEEIRKRQKKLFFDYKKVNDCDCGSIKCKVFKLIIEEVEKKYEGKEKDKGSFEALEKDNVTTQEVMRRLMKSKDDLATAIASHTLNYELYIDMKNKIEEEEAPAEAEAPAEESKK